MASLMWKGIRQPRVGIDNTAHPVRPVVVGNEMTMPICIAGYWDPSIRTAVTICVHHLLKLVLILR